ncbi:NAD(P)H-dependent flavin oxidoreductase [Heyndrickxia faecalis]|uniref:NAD(P)H-dependent flavin oxidoreductase n=1 Tax=Heyndrickxia faecalis TaxID=2824910 RepID=UPI0017F0C098|nr:nitronate monooxygenase [Bacillus sp. (in: firmicutes)]
MANPVTEMLGIKFPVFQGGMGNISDPALAASVSNAGGLGTIGAGTLPVAEIEKRMDKMCKLAASPCCVNIAISVHPNADEVIRLAIEKKIPVVSLSAGNPSKYIPVLHRNGIKVICVSSTVRQAKKAEAAGADILVCEGYEAAGINAANESTTMVLVPQIVKAVNIPVVAAGGIADGKGLAAALSLGAYGVQMGTRFIATKEAQFHPVYKKSVIEATDEATMIIGRPYKVLRRVFKNAYADYLRKLEESGTDPDRFKAQTSEAHHERGALQGDMEHGFINGGQIAGLIEDCPSVAQLLEEMVKEAQAVLTRSMARL